MYLLLLSLLLLQGRGLRRGEARGWYAKRGSSACSYPVQVCSISVAVDGHLSLMIKWFGYAKRSSEPYKGVWNNETVQEALTAYVAAANAANVHA